MCGFPENAGAAKPRIFVFVSSRLGVGWLLGVAIAEDGHALAAHLSCGREWFRHHLGLTSGQQHSAYRAHYSRGYQLVEVADDEILDNPGLAAALRRHEELVTGDEGETKETHGDTRDCG